VCKDVIVKIAYACTRLHSVTLVQIIVSHLYHISIPLTVRISAFCLSERRFGNCYTENKQKKPQNLNVGFHLSRQFAKQQDDEIRTYKKCFSAPSILISMYFLVLLQCFIFIKDFLLV